MAWRVKRLARAVKRAPGGERTMLAAKNRNRMADEKKPTSARTRRYYIRDPRQRSPFAGKPEGGWLRYPPSPAVWVRSRLQAHSFTTEEIEAIKQNSPYFEGCDIVPVDDDNTG